MSFIISDTNQLLSYLLHYQNEEGIWPISMWCGSIPNLANEIALALFQLSVKKTTLTFAIGRIGNYEDSSARGFSFDKGDGSSDLYRKTYDGLVIPFYLHLFQLTS